MVMIYHLYLENLIKMTVAFYIPNIKMESDIIIKIRVICVPISVESYSNSFGVYKPKVIFL